MAIVDFLCQLIQAFCWLFGIDMLKRPHQAGVYELEKQRDEWAH